MAEAVYLDTNVLLRYFLRDEPAQFAAMQHWMSAGVANGDARPVVAPATLSEMLFVARAPSYGRGRLELSGLIDAILRGPFEVLDRDVVLRANELYRSAHDDWDDCLVAAYAIERADGQLLSFDRALDRIPGLTRIEPTVSAVEEEA